MSSFCVANCVNQSVSSHKVTPSHQSSSRCVLFLPVSLPPVSEETDYIDLDLVEFHDEELRDIASILELSDTTKDKVTFTV